MRARLLMPAAVLFAPGCAAILGIDDGTPRGDGGIVDAGVEATIVDVAVERDSGADVVVVPTCKVAGAFTSIKAIAELDTSGVEQHPRLLPDEKTIVFQREQPSYATYVATRADRSSPFSAPTLITELVAAGDAADPTLDPTGLRIVFASSRAGGLGSFDLWTATRPNVGSAFSAATALTGLNDTQIDHYPNFAGPSALYFSSGRAGLGSEDIYRSAVTGSAFAAPVLVTGLSTPSYEGAPAVSSDELLAYVESSVTDDAGSNTAVFASFRASTAAPWPKPTLVPELRGGDSTPGWISPDGCRFYFTSNRSGNWDLWVAERTP